MSMTLDWSGLGVQPVMVAVTLRSAASFLRERGWYQGRFRDPDSQATDATQAIADVLGIDLDEASREDTRLPIGGCALLGATLNCVAEDIDTDVLARWNDKEERTPSEVIDMFERVAAALDQA